MAGRGRDRGAGRRCSSPGSPPIVAAPPVVRSFRARFREGGVSAWPRFEGRRRDEAGASIPERGRGAGPPPKLQPPHSAFGNCSGELLQRFGWRSHAARAHRGAGGQAPRVSEEETRR